MNIRWMAVALAAALMAPAVHATEGTAEGAPTIAKTDWKHPFASRKVKKLATEFNVPETEVRSLRDRNMRWKEVRQTLEISQRSGKPSSEIADLRETGMSWDDISSKYGTVQGLERNQGVTAPGETKSPTPERQRQRTPSGVSPY